MGVSFFCFALVFCALSWQRGAGSEGVSGWASMLSVLPSAGLLCACSSRTGGCATRPSGSNMLAIPWPQARGRPALPCAPPTPTRRPARYPLSPLCPALRMRRLHSFDFVNAGVKEVLTRLPAADRHPGHGKLLLTRRPAHCINPLRTPPAGRNRDVGAAGGAPCWRRAAERRGGHARSACFVN
jgi:hypothetical protein